MYTRYTRRWKNRVDNKTVKAVRREIRIEINGRSSCELNVLVSDVLGILRPVINGETGQPDTFGDSYKTNTVGHQQRLKAAQRAVKILQRNL